jgi:hypothetical protein
MVAQRPVQEAHPRDLVRFKLNAFINQVTLWIDAEIRERFPVYRKIPTPKRIAMISSMLVHAGVAVERRDDVATLVPIESLEKRCGGSRIDKPTHYELDEVYEPSSRLVRIVDNHFHRRRLVRVVDELVAVFLGVNLGYTLLQGVDSDGLYQITLTAKGLRYAAKAYPNTHSGDKD